MASSTHEQELRVSGPEEVEEEEEKLRGKREEEKGAQEGSSAVEAEPEGAHTLTDATFSGPQDATHSDKEKECLACQFLSVPVEDLDPQLLSALDSPCTSSPGDGASGEDQHGNRDLPAHGGENNECDSAGPNQERDNSDLDFVWRDQTQEQKEENPNNTPNLDNAENQENQGAEQCDQERSVPIVMVTNLEETKASAVGQAEGTAESVKQEGTESADANLAACPGDVTDFSGSDLQSLKSDTLSLLSETTVSGKSDEQESPEEDTRSVAASSVMDGLEEDTRSVATSSVMEGPEEDTRSVTASSVMSLFQRMQMDPLEREWLRCAALGNAPGLCQLLLQDPNLAPKKDFVTTALHWAAKQGRIETVDMMARSGADVNQRAGYTPLHLASLHGHAHIIQLLINNYNAKVNIRDYHGKMAAHYWNGSMDVFNRAGSQSGGKWSRGRRGQRYGQFSALLSRSWSQGNLNVELLPGSLELTPRLLPRSETNIQTLMDTF